MYNLKNMYKLCTQM